MPKKLKFKEIKKLGDINVSVDMARGLEKAQMRIAERISNTKKIFSKLSMKTKDSLDEISDNIKSANRWFEDFSNNINDFFKKKHKYFNQSVKEIIDNLTKIGENESISQIKTVEDEIEGDLTVDDIQPYLTALWENHETAQSKFLATGKEEYGEMALDIKVAITNIEEIRKYLIERGRFDKVKYDYSFA